MSWTCADFLKLNNGVGQGVIQFLKSPHKSNSFRRESISKLPGSQPMNVLPLVRGHHITPGNFEMLSRLNASTCANFLKTEWQTDLDHCSVLKSPHNSNLFRHESISKLPDLIWWPSTKDINVHRLTPWQLWNALSLKSWTCADFLKNWMTTWPRPLFSF